MRHPSHQSNLISERDARRYFILWLRDYTARYTIWARQSREQPHSRVPSTQARAYRTLSTPHPPPNPALALFYLRAKETFLTPDGPYALRLPQDVLSPFHFSSLGVGVGGPAGGSWPHAYASHRSDSLFGTPPPPPDPAVFAEVADRVRASLSESLDRFVVATFHNVGMPRAYCGCAGGTVIGLTGRFVLYFRSPARASGLRRLCSSPSRWLFVCRAPTILSRLGRPPAYSGFSVIPDLCFLPTPIHGCRRTSF